MNENDYELVYIDIDERGLNNMDNETIKKLGLCYAYAEIFGCDEFRQIEIITEENGCFYEWQSDLENPNIIEIKDKIIEFFNSLNLEK